MMAPSSAAVASPPAVRIVEQFRVFPGHDGAFPDVSLPLTFFDVPWLENHPVQRLLFYRWVGLDTPHFAAHVLPRLRRSLSLALRHFYPLAGRVRRGISSAAAASSEVVGDIFCGGGDYVLLTLAELLTDSDARKGCCYFDHLAGNRPRQVKSLRPLVPVIPAAAVMTLQATLFHGAGFCLGVSVGHLVCDGASFVRFLEAWASACRLEDEVLLPDSNLPVIDRTLVSGTTELYRATFDFQKYLTGVARPSVDEHDDFVQSTFLIRRAHIEEVRRRVTEHRPPRPPLRYSSFVLACAYVWVCLLKTQSVQEVQKTSSDHETENDAYFMFAVDCRNRLRPPLPAAYFGNCLRPCFVDGHRNDLLGGEIGVAGAAEAIAESVARMTEGDVLRGAEEWMPMIAARLPRRLLSTVGSPRFGVYGLDFGWGRPEKVEVVGIENSGGMALAESRDDPGGIEVGLALPAPDMAKFTSLFSPPGAGYGKDHLTE